MGLSQDASTYTFCQTYNVLDGDRSVGLTVVEVSEAPIEVQHEDP